ncbi:SDR family NAD(P)-dependent oxidoreductase [Aliiglaciecola sp. LCG003]|uniref:SDR family NAD(P)-dependent oxidoreductase n=1 Tax=Aliiglaciecola sp. LCG003 TaxID=3053655 RepID=UPI0025746556|nr:SDR family NAD(P)-dependent oxidoreductase [Aliiglaciecola sp. LCG003]WJG10598.1 SDR family oxidoreductase [Aliiglaciecola sp. LCG003]
MLAAQKWALITGASEGIGKQCAIALASSGFSLLLVARRQDKLERLAKNIIDEYSVECEFLSCDLTEVASIDRIYDWLNHSQRSIQVLLNNAGGAKKNAPLHKLDRDDWQHAFVLNLFSIVDLTNKILPLIDKQGRGRIINISSINANSPGFFNPHYSAAKAALNNFSKHLSKQLASSQVTVNTVSPGIIETEGWHGHMQKVALDVNLPVKHVVDEAKTNASKRIPLGRMGTVNDVASLVNFLASESAGYITGSDFTVDGGKRHEM